MNTSIGLILSDGLGSRWSVKCKFGIIDFLKGKHAGSDGSGMSIIKISVQH